LLGALKSVWSFSRPLGSVFWEAADAKDERAVFVKPGRIAVDEKPVPEIGPLDALVRVTTTTICGTDIHIRGYGGCRPSL
jgi:hypothetical protein